MISPVEMLNRKRSRAMDAIIDLIERDADACEEESDLQIVQRAVSSYNFIIRVLQEENLV